MSRLIFEGDTTERFGRLFPKPFIQKIRVYDNSIEADVVLYFRIEEDVSAEDFIDAAGLSSLKILTGPISEDNLETARTSENVLTAWQGSIGRSESGLAVINNLVGKEYDLFYNSEGLKFIRFFLTEQFANFAVSGKPQYLISFSFFLPSDADPYLLANNSEEQYKKQFSPISYEKVSNSDGSLNIEREIIFREPDGNAYGKTPLQSLSRNFKKTDTISHRRVREIINPIVTPFVGVIPEADRVSATLSNFSNDPKLLTQLQKDINSFSNKSTATTTGQLYGNLVDAVANIDNLLQGEDTLNKRLEIPTKIKDLRAQPPNISDLQLSTTTTSQLLEPSTFDGGIDYFPNSIIYRNLETSVKPSEFASEVQAYIQSKVYSFFDYEKALNYKSNISKVFNPYNIQNIFGKNSLNQYFQVENVECNVTQQGYTSYVYTLEKDQENKKYSSTVKGGSATGYVNGITLYNGETESYVFQAGFVERGLDTIEGLNGYRLKTYEFDYLKPYSLADNIEFVFIKPTIKDTTNIFYDQYIREKLRQLKEKLGEYQSYAEQFCSYNNIDGRFNDFFVDSISNLFEEPFPWNECPLWYHSIFSLVLNSWASDGYDSDGFPIFPDPPVRRGNGERSNLEKLKTRAQITVNAISPTTGDLESLQEFYIKFEKLFNLLDVNGRIPNAVNLYTTRNNDIELSQATSSYSLSQSPQLVNQVPVDVSIEVFNPTYSELTYLKPTRTSIDAGFIDKTWQEFEEEFQFYNLNELEFRYKVEKIVVNIGSDDSIILVEDGSKVFEYIYDTWISDTNFKKFNDTDASPSFYMENYIDTFYQRVYNKIKENIDSYQNELPPIEIWRSNFDAFSDIATEIYNETAGFSIFRVKRTNSKFRRKTSVFFKEREILLFICYLMINYYQYSYYVGRGSSAERLGFAEPIELKTFMNQTLYYDIN